MSDYGTLAQRASVLAVVVIHGICLAFVLQWNNQKSLFGTANYELSRYYSTKTTHVHRVNTVSPLISDPSHWESLGLIIPASDEQNSIQKFKIGTYDESFKDACENMTFTSACWLENNHADYVLLNGESISMISQISPSVYFATLVTIYLLSSIPFVSNLFATTIYSMFTSASKSDVEKHEDEKFIEKCIRYILIWIVLGVYFCGLIFAFGANSFINETEILDIKVRYSISSHLASIIPCTITIFIYLLHLRGRNLSWIATENTHMALQQDGLSTARTEHSLDSDVLQMSGAPAAMAGLHGVYFVGGTAVQMNGTEGFFTQIISRWTPSMATSVGDAHPDGHFYYGPNSSEASVVGALTVFLGGMGSLGLSRGVIPEVQVQLIMGCTLGFALLEVCSHRLRAYFSFMFGQLLGFYDIQENDKDTVKKEVYTTGTSYFWGVTFIRFVILCLQLWLLILYNNTIMHLQLESSLLQQVLYVLFIVYWLTQLATWMDIFNADWFTGCWEYVDENMTSLSKREKRINIRMSLEFGFCFVAFFVFIIALCNCLFENRLRRDDDKLVKYENIQYDLKDVTKNAKCSTKGTFSGSSLVHKLITKDGTNWETEDSWTSNSNVNPVELKVYFWTKGWNVQLTNFPSFVAWFCQNGLEHHWGQCLNSKYYCGNSNGNMLPGGDRCDTVVSALVSSAEKGTTYVTSTFQ